MLKIITILPLFFVFTTWAQSQQERIQKAYEENDMRYDLNCFYFNPNQFRLISPIGKTIRKSGSLKRNFKLESNNEDLEFDFEVLSDKKAEASYMIKFKNGLQLDGKISSNREKEFYLPVKKIDARFRNFSSTHELYKIMCQVNFAIDEKITLNSINNPVHINVHPHDRYDYNKLTLKNVEQLYADNRFKSYVLLEEGNFKGNLVDLSNFLEMREYFLIKNDYPMSILIPLDVEFRVSPAGHNFYHYSSQENFAVTYTGGNHNYCMWNNTRRLIESYLNSKETSNLVINYRTDSIVVQRVGLVNLNFSADSIQKSNLLKDVLDYDSKQAKEYIEKYFTYFTSIYINYYKGLFKKLTFINDSSYLKKETVIHGTGKRELKIIFNYL